MAPSSLCGRGGPSSRTACRWGGSSTISTKGRWRRRSGREGRWVDGGPASSYLHAMALLPIIETPDPRLRVISKPVETFDAELKTLVADMFETMYDAPGIGLAARQAGVAKRKIGNATCRGREGQYVKVSVVGVYLKKKKI